MKGINMNQTEFTSRNKPVIFTFDGEDIRSIDEFKASTGISDQEFEKLVGQLMVENKASYEDKELILVDAQELIRSF